MTCATTPTPPATTVSPAAPLHPVRDAGAEAFVNVEAKPSDPKVDFLIELADALAAHGVASHELEEMMSRCAARIGVEARFSATPTAVWVAVGRGERQRAHMSTISGARTSLRTLVDLYAVSDDVAAKRIDAARALTRLRRAVAPRVRKTAAPGIFASSAMSASFLALIGAGVWDVLAGAFVGFLAGAVVAWSASYTRLGRLTGVIAGFAAALGAILFDRAAGPVSVFPVTLAAVLPLLPGMAVTTSVAEIASGSLVSGASRLAGAFAALLTVGFGVGAGYRLCGAGVQALGFAGDGQPYWVIALAVLVAGFSIAVTFEARIHDVPVVLVSGLVAVASAHALSALAGAEFGALGGAFVIGVLSNAYERRRKRPPHVVLLPGVLLLVPGSIGLRGVQSMLDADTLGGVNGLFQMFLIAVAIVTGLLLANVFLAPGGGE